MQPIRQTLLRVDSILFCMSANDLEAVVQRSKTAQFEGSFRKLNLQLDHTKIGKQRIDNSLTILA